MNSRLLEPRIALLSVGLVCTLLSIPSLAAGNWVGLPQVALGICTLGVAYLACWYTAEKLRLDLLDRRFEIYTNMLTFCSIVTQNGDLTEREGNREQIAEAILAAGNSFRGIGFHKTRALFGEDIHGFMSDINSRYAYIVSFQDNRDERYYRTVMEVWNSVVELPERFRPYVYFGDYRLPSP